MGGHGDPPCPPILTGLPAEVASMNLIERCENSFHHYPTELAMKESGGVAISRTELAIMGSGGEKQQSLASQMAMKKPSLAAAVLEEVIPA